MVDHILPEDEKTQTRNIDKEKCANACKYLWNVHAAHEMNWKSDIFVTQEVVITERQV